MSNYQNDIERYRSGKMTPAEQHALEKQALSDPFLADALEGAESLSQKDFLHDVAELNQKISGIAKNRWLWPLRIAASVVGIALVSSIVILSIKDDHTQLASNQKQSPKPQQTEAQTTDTVKNETEKSGGEELIASSTSINELKSEEKKPALATRKENENPGAAGTTALTTGPVISATDTFSAGGLMAAAIRTDSVALTNLGEMTEEGIALTDLVLTSPPSQQPTQSRVANEDVRLTTTSGLHINGQVRDQQGQPLPGVNIITKGKALGVVTNAEGKYTMTLPDTSATLVYSFIGFVSQEMNVNKSNNYADVQLLEDATQLSEVVVTGYGEAKADGEPVVRLAEPIGGRKAYDKYLDEQKLYPQQAIENKVEGKVVIEFTVSTTGSVGEFVVIRKLGYGCDEEVIRLVKEGVAWRPSYIDNEPVESLVRVKTRFELPKKK